ncbi:MAG: peptidylprolyl isomerase [Bacilli bacterium]|nr:peptidylprolyl isomerase [Bacilli bacterium]MBQ3469288.1 peptidylprolyl isomerase [Bacilli bacterium]
MQKKIGYILVIVALLGVITGCGSVKLKNGEKAVVTYNKKGKISSDALYKEIVKKYGINNLIDMIDHKLFDKKYPADDEEKSEINNQIAQIKSQYGEANFENAIQTYYGVKDEKELRRSLSLDYKRDLAVKDYLKKQLTDEEIKNYYDNNIYGDIKASHILISANITDDMDPEEQEQVKEKAREKAEKIIEKLNNGKKFADLAKKYSDDEATASKGGDLGYFNKDSNFDEDFVNAAILLKKGEYTKEPVQSQYGYHIIKKIKEKDKPSLKKAKDDIKTTLAEEKLKSDNYLHNKTLRDIREEKKVKFKDSYLKKEYKKLMNRLTGVTKE